MISPGRSGWLFKSPFTGGGALQAGQLVDMLRAAGQVTKHCNLSPQPSHVLLTVAEK